MTDTDGPRGEEVPEDAQALAVLSAVLGMTCVDPKDNPPLGFCCAGRHQAQARKALDLLRSQGYDVTHSGRHSAGGPS